MFEEEEESIVSSDLGVQRPFPKNIVFRRQLFYCQVKYFLLLNKPITIEINEIAAPCLRKLRDVFAQILIVQN